jgi:enoyl-CoA hydratase
MKFETLIYEKEGGIRIVTLNRPERLNTFNFQLMFELEKVCNEIDEDGEARAVILTGAGRGFCAGADVKMIVDSNNTKKPPTGRNTFFSKLEDVKVPVIAAIHGPCIGGGLELALCCDFRIASEGASFGLGEVKLGAIPGGGGTARLPRLIGIGKAKEFLYFGNRVDAQEAYRIGLVNKVVSPEKLMEEARNWAAEVAERPPLSLRMLKDCVNIGMQLDLFGALDYEAKCFASVANSEDLMEGMRAFAEKRKPVFKGR